MVKDLSVDMAALIGCWCATMLYGVNIVLYIGCVYILVYKRRGSPINKVLIGTSSLQFALATGHVITVLRALIEGFVWAGRTGTIEQYWFDMSQPVHVAQEALYIANSVVGDAILVWRLWVIWPTQRWICVIPALCVVATAVCGTIAQVNLAHLDPTDPLFLTMVLKWVTATWSLSIALQTSVTALIAYQILSTCKFMPGKRFGSNQSVSVVWTVVESGALYSASTLCLLVLFVLKTQAGAVIGDSLGQLSAIFPTLIIVRVGLGLTHGPESMQSLPSTANSSQRSPLTINVSRQVESLRSPYELEIGSTVSSSKKESFMHLEHGSAM